MVCGKRSTMAVLAPSKKKQKIKETVTATKKTETCSRRHIG